VTLGSAGGVRKIVVKRGAKGGQIRIKAKGASLPCAALAPQNTPVEVTMRPTSTGTAQAHAEVERAAGAQRAALS
jgi:hypothetical protein